MFYIIKYICLKILKLFHAYFYNSFLVSLKPLKIYVLYSDKENSLHTEGRFDKYNYFILILL